LDHVKLENSNLPTLAGRRIFHEVDTVQRAADRLRAATSGGRHGAFRVMQSLAEEGMTVVEVTQEMSFARKVGARLVFMEG
jgi:hypothetical protein